MARNQKVSSLQTRTIKTRIREKAAKVLPRRAVPSAARRRDAVVAGTRTALAPMTLETPGQVTPEERWNLIALAAYYRAEQRGFVGGDPAHDWWEAELEVDAELARREE